MTLSLELDLIAKTDIKLKK